MAAQGPSSDAPPPASSPASLHGAAGVVTSATPSAGGALARWLRSDGSGPSPGLEVPALAPSRLDGSIWRQNWGAARPSPSTERTTVLRSGDEAWEHELPSSFHETTAWSSPGRGGGLCVKSSACSRLEDVRCTCPYAAMCNENSHDAALPPSSVVE
jgi:hypothetical protein